MSIRITLLYLVIIGLAAYAFRDWFKSLCGLILLMAVMQHPDMPKNIMGIQGLNPWNLLMADIALAWMINRSREGLSWDLPRYIAVLLIGYFLVVTISVVRMIADPQQLEREMTFSYMVSERWINTIKWVIPGLLLFDGCRTRSRLHLAIFSILAMYFLLALQVIRWMPLSSALDGDVLQEKGLKVIQREIGYSRVNMSMLLSGASWAILGLTPLFRKRWAHALIILAFLIVAFGQALTGGRMGYITWGMVGLILCLIRWRKALLLFPVMIGLVLVVMPGVADRLLQGFGEQSVTGGSYTNDYEVTSGRTLIWPYVIEKIHESVALGYGGMAMVRTGLRDYLWARYRESFPHPHNAYFEMLLDNGLVGLVVVTLFYGVVIFHAVRLFLDSRSPVFVLVGGISTPLILALLVAGVGSQTFYPREGSVGMWAAIGIMLRVSLERSRAYACARMGSVRRRVSLPVRPRGAEPQAQ